MLINNLQKIVQDGLSKNLSLEYIKIELKESLIYYALDFIYNSPKWNHLIFGGGTALKIVGKTGRLSEDLDMDYTKRSFDYKSFLKELILYFENLGIKNITSSIRQEGKIITLKLPILKELGLIKNIKSESDFLYLKIEIEKNKYPTYKITVKPIIKDNLFFVVRCYDFETLFANKIGAILGRKGKIFKDKYDFKGRDFYDLIWFLEQGVKLNLKRTKEILKAEQGVNIKNYNDIWDLLEKRIKLINTKGIYEDMKNLVQAPESIKRLSKNYLEIYKSLITKF